MASQDCFDFCKADSGIRELEEMAQQLRTLRDGAYAGTIGQTADAWSGAGSDVFLLRAQALRELLEEAASQALSAQAAYGQAYQTAKYGMTQE